MNLIKIIKNHKIISIILVVIVIGLFFYFRPRHAPQIETQRVEKGDIIESLSETGKIDTSNSVDLSFMVGGKLDYLGAKKGDLVKAGQTIATIDQSTAQKNLKAALLDYSKTRNTFDQTQDDNLDRKPDEALNDAMKRILQDNQFDLDKSVNSVELQSLANEKSVLASPIKGILIRADATTAGVNVGPTTIFTIADPSNLLFKAEIDEADIGKVRIGEPMKITLDAYPDQAIDTIVNYIDFETHTTSTGGDAYYVQASMPQVDWATYRLGMNGDVDIISDEAKNVMTIPLSSIVNNQYVFVKTPTNFEKRNVIIGLTNDTDAEVKDGLKLGEEVAIDPTIAQNYSNVKISPTP